MLTVIWGWIKSNSTPAWTDCAGLSPELRCWRLQIGNLSIDTDGRLWRKRAPPAEGSQLVVPRKERQAMIRRFHDSLFAGHLGISRTVFRLQTRVYWPRLRDDVWTYIASCTVCITRKSPFFSNVVCRFGMPTVIHSDQGREFENKVMHELCILGGAHKTKTTPYHPESDGLVERFNRTLLMMLAMFAGEHKDDCFHR